MVAVAYEMWSLTRGSKYSDLARKRLAFWKTGRRGEMVATGGLTVSQILNIDIFTLISTAGSSTMLK